MFFLFFCMRNSQNHSLDNDDEDSVDDDDEDSKPQRQQSWRQTEKMSCIWSVSGGCFINGCHILSTRSRVKLISVNLTKCLSWYLNVLKKRMKNYAPLRIFLWMEKNVLMKSYGVFFLSRRKNIWEIEMLVSFWMGLISTIRMLLYCSDRGFSISCTTIPSLGRLNVKGFPPSITQDAAWMNQRVEETHQSSPPSPS